MARAWLGLEELQWDLRAAPLQELCLSLLFPFVTGVWSLGLPGFMAVGAYAGGWLTQSAGWPVWAALIASAACGALSTLPFGLLALRIRGLAAPLASPEEWPRIHAELVNFWVAVEQQVAAHHAAGRLKQWLGMLARTWPQAAQLAGRIRTLRTPAEIGSCLT